jgi:hypothetical protein
MQDKDAIIEKLIEENKQLREHIKLVSLHSYMGRIEGCWVFA